MTTIEIVENKISLVRKYLKICLRYQNFSREEIENDIDRRGAVERYLFLLVQSAIDLAESFVALKNFRKPTTMSEAFHILEEEGIIDTELSQKMIQMTGFRNIIVHSYDKIDYEVLYDILQNGTNDIENFLEIIEN